MAAVLVVAVEPADPLATGLAALVALEPGVGGVVAIRVATAVLTALTTAVLWAFATVIGAAELAVLTVAWAVAFVASWTTAVGAGVPWAL